MEEETDLEKIRLDNLRKQEEFLASLIDGDPMFAETIQLLKKKSEERQSVSAKPSIKRKTSVDKTFKFTGAIPAERRCSLRVRNKNPEYSYTDLPDEKQISKDSDSLDALEEVVYRVTKRRPPTRTTTPQKIIPVEDVTDEMIANIQTSGNKVYGADGTSCHQCRQKTVDTKTICRSGFCFGVRGQFCGICVINRYGEDPIAALRDPNWKCYVCRGCCNCSFCRLKEGKRPTGILAPMAKTYGYKSVMDFLKSLKGYGDYEQPSKDPENLLGFEGNTALMGGNKKIELISEYPQDDPKGFRQLLNGAGVEDCKKPQKTAEDLMGFEGNMALMSSGEKIELKTEYPQDESESIKELLNDPGEH